ncbi:MAG: protein-L-isoaspartate(D-aspartate) O-methyltransferase [Bacteroidetes bacterium]|nr:protein-L-isoaspartate(D-aspartate) O-methyltransferase [Bacteroidota bacterium]MCH8233894.1 protein-L-isoaspartate(D-aspartate) O-methyltransferase [Bacteroidota bacterium]
MTTLNYIFYYIILLTPLFSSFQDRFGESRNRMVSEQIEKRGISDKDVLKAMRIVKRHLFIPQVLRNRAYNDGPVPIGYGQTISQPYIVAYMTDIIDLKPNSNVLEIGTGSGYQAAVLAEITNKVYTIEIIQELGEAAKETFKDLGYNNIESKIADGYFGWEEKGPFDAIIVTAATEFIPPPLIGQLKPGGKMVIPVGSPMQVQFLMLVEKNVQGKVKTRSLFPVRFVPFTRN